MPKQTLADEDGHRNYRRDLCEEVLAVRRISFLVDLALCVDQGLRLDQHALAFVPLARPAESHDDSMPAASGLGPTSRQCITRRKELQVVQAHAAQAGRTRRLHHQQVAGDRAAMAWPVVVQRRDDHQLGRRAGLLRQALLLLRGKPWRYPMRSIRLFDMGVAAPTEIEALPARRGGHVRRLARPQTRPKRQSFNVGGLSHPIPSSTSIGLTYF